MIKLKRFHQINENYFSSVPKENPFSGLTRVDKNISTFQIEGETLLIQDNNFSKAILKHNDKEVAEGLYDIIDGKMDLISIMAKEKGKGYAKILMVYFINKFGIENIERDLLTSDGQKMFDDLDKFFGFDYQEYIESITKYIHKKTLVKSLAKNKPLISTFLDNICSYGRKEALNMFSDEIKSGQIEGYPVSKLLDISEWVDGSVENKNGNSELPKYIKSILEEIKRL
jgi:hypothetical protein